MKEFLIAQFLPYIESYLAVAASGLVTLGVGWVWKKLGIQNIEAQNTLNAKLDSAARNGIAWVFGQLKEHPSLISDPGKIVDMVKSYMREQTPDDLDKIGNLTKYIEARIPQEQAKLSEAKPLAVVKSNVAQPVSGGQHRATRRKK